MNRATLVQDLAKAEEHVALGLAHIARQHEIIAKMDRQASTRPRLATRWLWRMFERRTRPTATGSGGELAALMRSRRACSVAAPTRQFL